MAPRPKLDAERSTLHFGVFWTVLTLLLFAVDCATPLGAGVPLAYIAVVILAGLSTPPRFAVGIALLCTALTFLGMAISPGTVNLFVGANRVFTIAAIWGAALIGLQRRRLRRTREKRLARQMAVLVELMHQPVAHKQLDQALQTILEASARTLGVEIVSVWQFNETQSTLCCLARWEKSTGRLSSGLELTASDYPNYFAAARRERSIAAHDACRDPRTREFAAEYLPAFGITSMLDAAIWLEGRLIGLVCHEHVGAARRWTPDEQNFAASIANFVSLLLEDRARRRTEQLLRGRNRVFEKLASGAELREVLTTLLEITHQHQPQLALTLQLAGAAAEAFDGRTLSTRPDTLHAGAESAAYEEAIFDAAGEKLGSLQVHLDDPTQLSSQDREVIRSTADLAGIAIHRKLVERALQSAHDELEQRVAQRTAELERSNQDLQQFAYVASHDLQEPLRAVAGYCQLLQSRYLHQIDKEGRDFLEYAVGGAHRMQNLVNGLLEYSRVGSSPFALSPTAAGRAVAEAQANLQTALQESAARIEVVGPLPEVLAEHAQLVALFQNLFANAVKYRGATPPHIDVCAKSHNGMVEFIVRDNGLGIPLQHRERIFDIFYRLHPRDQHPGVGMGLATCKKIVERHGGCIWVDADDRPGAIFHFTLPLAA